MFSHGRRAYSTLFWIGFLTFCIVPMLALALNLGRFFYARAEMYKCADAAALAAAQEKRGPWIKQHADEFDVLLTNARLVEVGLNLTMLSTAIFFEMEWSLYTVWQAMRRLYRPGAKRDVKLYFPVYRNTLEESALDLIGAKMLAAMCFYGDEASGSLVDESDQGNLLNDIVRKAMGELQVGRAEGIFSLGNDMLVTDSPLGSPTAVSPRVVTFTELAARRREFLQPVRRVKRLTAPNENQAQPSLF